MFLGLTSLSILSPTILKVGKTGIVGAISGPRKVSGSILDADESSAELMKDSVVAYSSCELR